MSPPKPRFQDGTSKEVVKIDVKFLVQKRHGGQFSLYDVVLQKSDLYILLYRLRL